jgi:hypothetical protein
MIRFVSASLVYLLLRQILADADPDEMKGRGLRSS